MRISAAAELPFPALVTHCKSILRIDVRLVLDHIHNQFWNPPMDPNLKLERPFARSRMTSETRTDEPFDDKNCNMLRRL